MAPAAHAYNPSYSGGRDQEDDGLKPAWANSSRDPILKNSIPKRAGGVAQGGGPEFKPQYHRKKGRKKGREGGREGGREEGKKKGRKEKKLSNFQANC
jgi:hypothetical protein